MITKYTLTLPRPLTDTSARVVCHAGGTMDILVKVSEFLGCMMDMSVHFKKILKITLFQYFWVSTVIIIV